MLCLAQPVVGPLRTQDLRASKTFDTQQQAVDYGRTAAKKVGTELYIHGRDGTIKDKRSYGNDPMPPRDKK